MKLQAQVLRKKGVALYYQLAEAIRNQIETGQLRPGDQLPSEDELCRLFQVSRTTVRAALNMLTFEGLIHREQGRGTYVAEPKFEQAPPRLLSFSEEMRERGLKPGSRVLAVEKIPATEQIAEKLNIKCGDFVIAIKRLRLANNEPMGLQTAYIPFALCPNLINEDLSQSLYSLLIEKYRISLYAAKDTYYATILNTEEANLLKVPPGSPAFVVERVTMTVERKPVEYVRSLMRGDRYKISLWLESYTK